MPPAISPVMSPASLKGPLVRKKRSPPTITSTNTTTTTTTTTTLTSTQPVGKDEQIAELEQEVRTRRKRLRKHISEDPDDSNPVDFKPIVMQVDDSEDFSSQDLESSLSISTQLVEISDEEMEDETDSSSQMEELSRNIQLHKIRCMFIFCQLPYWTYNSQNFITENQDCIVL
jgi:hypothetical protein